MDPFNNNSGGNHSDSKFESDSEDPALGSDFIDTTLVHNNDEDEDEDEDMLWEINLQSEELLSNADTTSAWQLTPWNSILVSGEGEDGMPWWEINLQSEELLDNAAETTPAWQQRPSNNILVNGEDEDGMPREINLQSEELPNNAGTMSAWQQTPWNNILIDREDDVMQWEITFRRSEELPNNADTMSAWQQAPSNNNTLFSFDLSPPNTSETLEWEWQSDEDYFDIEIPPRRILPAAKFVVEGLPEVEMRGGTEAVCAVCSEEIAEGEKVKMLPCWHYYHGECIVPWLKMRTTCPVCWFELPTDGELGWYLSNRRRILEATTNNGDDNGSLKDFPVRDSFELSLVLDYEDCKQH
ncbi:hypothetical protein SLE2022_190020 [Rubroshorea leprosula]